MPKIMIFSQDNSLCSELSDLLRKNSYTVTVFSDPEKSINTIREESYDLIFIDFPKSNQVNHELITSIHCFHDLLPIIVVTDIDKIDTARKAIKNGATTYLTKPLNQDAILLTLKIALSHANLLIQNLLYKRSLQRTDGIGFNTTSSDYMLKIYALVEKVAPSDTVIMLTGEAGIGKETIARRIHSKSRRSKYSFCRIDCAELPTSMEDSELFGYCRKDNSQENGEVSGIFERNNGGTVFLDNVETLPMNSQIKILYMLQNKKIQIIGGSRIASVNIRLIVGSAHDLHEKTIVGEFCEDLYRKINTVPILIPPLRERRKDIPILVEDFLERFAGENSKNVDISSQALAVLCEYDWPGNIEQLETLIGRLVAANETGKITTDELPTELFRKTSHELRWGKIIDDKLDDIMPLKKYLHHQEKSYMQKVLEHSGGDKTLAAKKLGISLASFYRKLQEAML